MSIMSDGQVGSVLWRYLSGRVQFSQHIALWCLLYYNLLVLSILLMIHQKEVLEWYIAWYIRLKGFNFDQIKEIITIKNNNNIHLIKSILHYKPDCKPIDYITHGYCKNQIQNDSTIYVREKFRYKNKKESKKKMD